MEKNYDENWEKRKLRKKRVETSQNKMELNDTKGYRKHEIKTALYPSPTLASPNAIFTLSRYTVFNRNNK